MSCKESDLCWYIVYLNKDFLTLSYIGRGNTLEYKRVKYNQPITGNPKRVWYFAWFISLNQFEKIILKRQNLVKLDDFMINHMIKALQKCMAFLFPKPD